MKTFETEYKNQIAIELPDLWDRIEAGVDEYEAKKHETYATVANENIDNKVTNIKTKANNKKTFIIVGQVLGAAACLLLVVNVFRLGFGGSKEAATADAGATYVTNETADFSYSDSVESIAADEAACETVMEESAPAQEFIGDDLDATEAEECITEEESSNATIADSAIAKHESQMGRVIIYRKSEAVDAVREIKEIDDLATIADIFECDEAVANTFQKIFRQCDIGEVIGGELVVVKDLYLEENVPIEGVTADETVITMIETVDETKYLVYTHGESDGEILEIIRLEE